MLSAEAACAKCIKESHPERIPYRYRDKYPEAFAAGTGTQNPNPGQQQNQNGGTAAGNGTVNPAF
jgi:hypothetical protein